MYIRSLIFNSACFIVVEFVKIEFLQKYVLTFMNVLQAAVVHCRVWLPISICLNLLYENKRCSMIVHETAIHQITVESKLLKVQIRPSTMNQSPHHNESCKRSRNTNCEYFFYYMFGS